MQIELTQQYVQSAAEDKLLTLAREIAESKSLTKPEIKTKILLATKIRLWLEALDYSVYLERNDKEKIVNCLADIADVNDFPVSIPVSYVEPPDLIIGREGKKGDTGTTGATGGGVPFFAANVSATTVVDSFPNTLAGSARWEYEVFDASNKRVEILTGTWLGTEFRDDGGYTLDPSIGDTSGISFQVNLNAGTVQLVAVVTSGIWEVRGSRIMIPVTGNGIVTPTSLATGNVWIGNSSNLPQARAISGAITISETGEATIPDGTITNAKIAAGVNPNKLIPLVPSSIVVTTTLGFISTITNPTLAELAHLSGARSNLQAQIDSIGGVGSITGAITPYLTSNAIANRVIISDPIGKQGTSVVTTTELNILSGLTASTGDLNNTSGSSGNFQSQINSKANSSVLINAGGALSGGGDLTSSRTLSVNVDNSTIEISSNALRIKGVSASQLSKLGGAFAGIIQQSEPSGSLVTGFTRNFPGVNWLNNTGSDVIVNIYGTFAYYSTSPTNLRIEAQLIASYGGGPLIANRVTSHLTNTLNYHYAGTYLTMTIPAGATLTYSMFGTTNSSISWQSDAGYYVNYIKI